MLKRTMLLASFAVAAMAFPAMASAAWTDNTVAIGANANVTFAGNAAFVGALGGTSCKEAEAAGTLEPGTNGKITKFQPKVSSCSTSGGLAGCTVTSVTSEKLPWNANTNTEHILIEAVWIVTTYHGAFCPYHEIRLTGNVTIDVTNPHAGTAGHITGTLHATNNTTGANIQNVTASGTQTITPSGTYGIT